METTENDSSTIHDNMFFSTASVRPCPSSPERPYPTHNSQPELAARGMWTESSLYSQPRAPASTPPMATTYQMEIWNLPNHELRRDNNSFAPLPPEVRSEETLYNPVSSSHYVSQPSASLWTFDANVYTQAGNFSRRPSHHSDPGFSTFPQDVPIHSTFTDVWSGTGSEIAQTPRPGLHDRTHTISYSAEPSPPAGTSPNAQIVRPVLRCYDHGCDGRRFSSISNLRRHQRERSGRSPVCFCPRCGAPFYRRWTRDHHVERGSCLRIPRWGGWSWN
ncbi:hypothetical protein AUEXF2481DRAFT_27221 [Aureobasidium subglaciale EXF-2481]|uniref:C2H2-type domain-containing protein n=1 Tax=Aureobasidium subglaciale (strain EXF-2481) TaxID=1043005 RepID=A0A074YUQ7_AURSE|nr:uncharacterized protein AUEXF2481DRAFT_27221 [Aureobasidium subglaciale EXF-2481]KEQ97877.1 hypothetical protein AUEXF2481DRAFT_27221 [Aureobasidium subglaciale EXF-2481]